MVLISAPGRALGPFFLFPFKRGNGAPGGARSLAIGSLAGFARPGLVRLARRTSPCEGPCASRRSIAVRIVGGRTLLRHLVSRSTTPSIEQGMADIDQEAQMAKFNSRVCKVLQHCGGNLMSSPGRRVSLNSITSARLGVGRLQGLLSEWSSLVSGEMKGREHTDLLRFYKLEGTQIGVYSTQYGKSGNRPGQPIERTVL